MKDDFLLLKKPLKKLCFFCFFLYFFFFACSSTGSIPSSRKHHPNSAVTSSMNLELRSYHWHILQQEVARGRAGRSRLSSCRRDALTAVPFSWAFPGL